MSCGLPRLASPRLGRAAIVSTASSPNDPDDDLDLRRTPVISSFLEANSSTGSFTFYHRFIRRLHAPRYLYTYIYSFGTWSESFRSTFDDPPRFLPRI